MKIPFSNRTVDVGLPVEAGQARVTVKAVMTDLHEQMRDLFSKLLEACVLLSPHLVRVTCRTPVAMEEFSHLGLTFRGKPLVFRACKTSRWVNITRLSYGVPEEAIKDALKPYGTVLQVKMDVFHNVYVGVRNVLMEISKPIPSRLLIAGHWCNTFHLGQVQTCFHCHKPGHAIRECPVCQAAISETDQALLWEAAESDVAGQRSSPALPTASSPKSYADTVRESEMAFEHGSSTDNESSDESESDDLIDVDESLATKRDRSDDDSAGSQVHEDKRGKSGPEFESPNLFSTLTDKAASSKENNGDTLDTGVVENNTNNNVNNDMSNDNGPNDGPEDNNDNDSDNARVSEQEHDTDNNDPANANATDNDNPDDTVHTNDDQHAEDSNDNDKNKNNVNLDRTNDDDSDNNGNVVFEESARARHLRVRRTGQGKKSSSTGKEGSGKPSASAPAKSTSSLSAPFPPNVPRKGKKPVSGTKNTADVLASFLCSKKTAPAPVYGSKRA